MSEYICLVWVVLGIELNSVCKVVGETGKAVIRKTEATESADKNMVIESLGQVDEDGCTVLSFIDGGYDIV
jgi:hypothetical protein